MFNHRKIVRSASKPKSYEFYRRQIHSMISDIIDDLELADEIFETSGNNPLFSSNELIHMGESVSRRLQDIQDNAKNILTDLAR